VVFAETEIISLINDGRALPDIVAGLHRAMAHRVASLARGIELDREITMTAESPRTPACSPRCRRPSA
jgi:activator of 2-hydroxyglutaryl-CoA dehydratase